MKYVLFILIGLFWSVSAQASLLGNCDSKTYNVIITNGQQQRTVTLAPTSGEVLDYGPSVTYQLHGSDQLIVTRPDEEYCIWSGAIKLQRHLFTSGASLGGYSLR